jgi:hypothetical protein
MLFVVGMARRRLLRLKTGVHQAAAFAPRAALPANAIAASVFYEKALQRSECVIKRRMAQ